jgi:hypothetical protein
LGARSIAWYGLPAVAYRACYHCELLFDVDDSPSGGMPCPQCGQPLEPYTPPDEQALESELYGEEAEAQQSTLLGEAVPAPVNPAIVATHAFDGLSSAVREQLAARQASLSSEMAQARPTAQVPTPAPQLDQLPGGKGPNATRILDVSGNQAAIEAMVADVRPPVMDEPEPQRTMAIDTSASPLAPPTASQEARFGNVSDKVSGRHTRIEGIPVLDAPVPPPTFSPVDTPPPVKRPEPPPPLEPIGPPAPSPRATQPPPRTTQPPPRASGDIRRTASMPAVGVPQPTLAPAPVSTAARAPAGSGSKKGLIIGLVAFVLLGGGGAAAFFLTRDKTPAAPVGEPAAEPSGAPGSTAAEATGDKLATALGDAQAELPRAKGGDPIMSDAPFLVGGPEGLSTSFGGVPGLPSLTLPEPQIDKDAGGEWVKPLKSMLEGNLGGNPGRLVMALDYRADARTAIRLVYSAHKAGFRQFGLGVDRGGDGRASLAFTLQPSGVPLPTGGAMIISVGSISVKVDAQDANGTVLSDGVAVPHKDAGGTRPDLDGVVARIQTILAAQPSVKRALIYPNPEMTMEQLASVVDRVSSLNGKPLFSEVSLAIR